MSARDGKKSEVMRVVDLRERSYTSVASYSVRRGGHRDKSPGPSIAQRHAAPVAAPRHHAAAACARDPSPAPAPRAPLLAAAALTPAVLAAPAAAAVAVEPAGPVGEWIGARDAHATAPFLLVHLNMAV